MDVREMKDLVCKVIEEHREEIIALGENIAGEPELGWKEFKTARKIQEKMSALGLEHKDDVAGTAVITPIRGRGSKVKLAVIGEMDALLVPEHPDADPGTGAAHCCGHHVQAAAAYGVALALVKSGVMKELDGDVVVMHVPAEEGVEFAFREELRKNGKITMFEGKPEMILRGCFDDIDMVIMQHIMCTEGSAQKPIKADCGGPVNALGCLAKMIRYTGRPSHAARPWEGINALDAAELGLMGINANRTTFRPEDNIRVHPIITKGGDLVNIVPADVRLEAYVRGANPEGIVDASRKVDQSLKAGAMAMGAECEILDIPLCMSPYESDELKQICYENMRDLLGDDITRKEGPSVSTDAYDISNLMPMVHMNFGGAAGVLHGTDFKVVDPEMAYINAAKVMACTAVDLLADGAEKALYVKKNFHAPFTMERYRKEWCGLE